MTFEALWKILLGVFALILGIYFGLPGRDERTQEEIDEALTAPGKRERVKRSFVAVDILFRQRKVSQLKRERAPFRTVLPDPRPRDEDATPEGDREPREGPR
jgi:hypothetical protein